MISKEDCHLLLNDFPELLSDDVVLKKEVLAHFGLLFSGYALLEAALQNFYIFSQQKMYLFSGDCRSKADWQSRHDCLERKAFAATMGNLINLVSEFEEITSALDELRKLKKSRDYFAHHFFREENDKLFSDESLFRLICGIDNLRRRVKKAELFVDAAARDVLKYIHPNVDVDAVVSEHAAKIKGDNSKNDDLPFCWE